MIVDQITNWRKYSLGTAWECACEFLQSLTPNTEEQKHFLMGEDVYANVMSYQTRTVVEAKLEAHREYVDIQAVLSGNELIDWYPIEGLQVKTPYDQLKDVEFFHRPEPHPARVRLTPGLFMLLYPQDAHMPQLMAGESPEMIKKVVIKIKLALLNE